MALPKFKEILKTKLIVPAVFLATTVIDKLKFKKPLSGLRRDQQRIVQEAAREAIEAATSATESARKEIPAKYYKMTFRELKKMLLEMFNKGVISKSLLGFLLTCLIALYRESEDPEERKQIIFLLLGLGLWALVSHLLL